MEVIIQCAWCQKVMGSKQCDAGEVAGPLVSHSICPSCIIDLAEEEGLWTDKNASASPRCGENVIVQI